MKIVQVSHVFLPNIGGIEYYVYRLARDLAKKKHQSFVITSGKKVNKKRVDGFDVFYLKKRFFLPRNPRILGLAKQLTKIKPDIVHIHSIWFYSSYQAIKQKNRLGFKIVNTVHGVYPDNASFAVKIFLFLFKPIAKKILKASDQIIVLTESEKDKLIRYFNVPLHKINIIENGIDQIIPDRKSIEHIDSKIASPYILFTGRIIPDKNPDILIRAFNKIRQNNDMRLVFLGPIESNYRNHLLGLADMPQNIVFVPPVNPITDAQILASYYKQAELSVAIGSWEGLPTRMLESMAQGTPTIVFRSGGSSQLIRSGENGYLLEDLSEEMLSKMIKQFLNMSAEQKKNMSERSVETITSYLWGKKVSSILSLYSNL